MKTWSKNKIFYSKKNKDEAHLYSSEVLCGFQAQARMQESSQKVDLLYFSLERHLSELPKDHPKYAAIKEELASRALPSYGTPKTQSNALSSLFKSASITGYWYHDRLLLYFHVYQFQVFVIVVIWCHHVVISRMLAFAFSGKLLFSIEHQCFLRTDKWCAFC